MITLNIGMTKSLGDTNSSYNRLANEEFTISDPNFEPFKRIAYYSSLNFTIEEQLFELQLIEKVQMTIDILDLTDSTLLLMCRSHEQTILNLKVDFFRCVFCDSNKINDNIILIINQINPKSVELVSKLYDFILKKEVKLNFEFSYALAKLNCHNLIISMDISQFFFTDCELNFKNVPVKVFQESSGETLFLRCKALAVKLEFQRINEDFRLIKINKMKTSFSFIQIKVPSKIKFIDYNLVTSDFDINKLATEFPKLEECEKWTLTIPLNCLSTCDLKFINEKHGEFTDDENALVKEILNAPRVKDITKK